jgi:hypothetical protein
MIDLRTLDTAQQGLSDQELTHQMPAFGGQHIMFVRLGIICRDTPAELIQAA